MKTAGTVGQAGAVEVETEFLSLEKEATFSECFLALCERHSYLMGTYGFSGNYLIQPLSQVTISLPEKEFLLVFYCEGVYSSLLEREDELRDYAKVFLVIDYSLHKPDNEERREIEFFKEKFENLNCIHAKEGFRSSAFFHYSLDASSLEDIFSSLVRRLENVGKEEKNYFA